MMNPIAGQFFDLTIWLSGAAHFVILIASFQVPSRLRWKQDLAQLTLALHAELLRGDRAALGLACFIGTYWTARILVDAFYFSHEDWPKGKEFVIGHMLLTCLFVALAASYWALFVWQVWLRAKS
jgi:hypothetical protein